MEDTSSSSRISIALCDDIIEGARFLIVQTEYKGHNIIYNMHRSGENNEVL